MDILNLEKSDTGGDSPRRRPRKLALNNVANIKRSIGRLVRDCDNEENADLAKYRILTGLLNALIAASKLDIEERIAKLEAYVDDAKDKNS